MIRATVQLPHWHRGTLRSRLALESKKLLSHNCLKPHAISLKQIVHRCLPLSPFPLLPQMPRSVCFSLLLLLLLCGATIATSTGWGSVLPLLLLHTSASFPSAPPHCRHRRWLILCIHCCNTELDAAAAELLASLQPFLVGVGF